MSTTQYNSAILQQFADDLYSRARWIIVTTAAKYGVVALIVSVIGAGIAQSASRQTPDTTATGMLVGVIMLLATAAGVSAGGAKAFQLKLQAQQILCQMQIEVNTRAASVGTKAFATHV